MESLGDWCGPRLEPAGGRRPTLLAGGSYSPALLAAATDASHHCAFMRNPGDRERDRRGGYPRPALADAAVEAVSELRTSWSAETAGVPRGRARSRVLA